MINLGLSAAQQKRFHEVLCSDHRVKVTVQFLDLEHRYISNVSSMLLDGQVNIDAKAEITRSATLTLLDPQRMIGLDSSNPADGQAYHDRMVKIIYSVWVDDEWVDVPVFVGPMTRVERNEDIVEIEAQGKEFLAAHQVVVSRTYPKGMRRVDLIRSIMEDLTGEDRFLFPNWRSKTSETVSTNPKNHPWNYAKKYAKVFNAMVFYDGNGYMRLRMPPKRTLWTFRDGDGGCVLTKPDVSYASDEIINVVDVTGGLPKGSKRKVHARAYIPGSHPMSTRRLGRNGVSRPYPEWIEDETIKSTKAAQKAAEDRVREIMVESAEVSFDSLVIPHLEENDLVRVAAAGVSVGFRLTKMTIPLSHEGVSSVGYLKRVSHNTKRIRRNR